jgi:hypothetical protein
MTVKALLLRESEPSRMRSGPTSPGIGTFADARVTRRSLRRLKRLHVRMRGEASVLKNYLTMHRFADRKPAKE